MKIKKLNESSLVDKKVSTLGKKGKPMYFTADQLKDAKAKYPEYDFEETTIEYSLPAGQKAYIAKKKTNESKYTSNLIGPDNLLMNAEEAYFDGNLGDFVADSLNDGSATEEELLAVTEKSSFIEYDDMLNAIDYAKSLNESFDISWNGNQIATSAESKSIKVFGAKAKKLEEAEEILYVIKDSHGNQLSRPTADDSELWDRVASMEARGRRGLRVVVYTGKKESLDEDKGQPRSNRYRTYFNRIKRAIEKGDEETLKRTKEAIMYAPAKELKNSEASELMDMIKNRKITESVSGKYGEVKYEPRRDGMSGESAVYANYHLFSNDGKYTPYWAGERPMGSSYNSVEDAVKGIDAFIDRQRKDGKMLYMKPVNEASYGGAFDIEDDQYFTRDDLVEFAEDVVDRLNDISYSKFDYTEVYLEPGNNLELTLVWSDYEETIKEHIDMRKIRKPYDLCRIYAPLFVFKAREVFSEYGADFGPHLSDQDYPMSEKLTENARGVGEYSDKLYGYLDLLQDKHDSDAIAYLASQLIRYCPEEDLKDLWFDRMQKVASDNGYNSDANESINESATEAQTIETGPKVGMAEVVNNLIKDEYEAIEGYNSAIVTATEEGFTEAVKVLTEIQAEEHIHVGQLQEVMKLFDPNADKVDDGKKEGAEQISDGINNLDDIPNTNIEEGVSMDNGKERWKEIYQSFKNVEQELNGDGEAITAVIDRMYQDNRDDPDYKLAYDKWASNE